MSKFDYILSTGTGLKKKGSLFATSLEAAKRKLQKTGKIIISITESGKFRTWFWQKPGLSFQDKMMFTKHMATMLKVGITITEALEILISQTPQKNNRRMYENILDMVKSGQSLSKSLRQYDYIFSEVFVNMVATGEKSGNLEKIFEHLDLQLEKEYELRKKIFSAFIYPAVIIGLTFLIMFGIVIFIMPKITKLFESFDTPLPFVTRLLIGFSSFIIEKPILAAAISVAVIVFFITIFKWKILKPFWHRIVIYLPVFGRLIISANLARFSRTMNSLLQSGVPVVEAMTISANMIGNSRYKKAIKQARDKIEQGANFGESLEDDEKLFPKLTTKTLYIGDKTGSLEVTTERLAELYEREVDSITRNLSVLLEPVLLIFMGILVGGIALSIILPIYQLPSLIEQ